MKNYLLLSIILGTGIFTVNHVPGSANTTGSSSNITRNTLRTMRPALQPVGGIYIVIDKSDYELSVYDEKGWYATYPVVFGSNTLADKRMEGDKKTPEGTFHIQHKKVHNKWSRFLGIDYPTQESWEKFKARKNRGEIPASASIGGAIGIHGTWPREDFVIDRFNNWTLGCISMKNSDVQELYTYTPVGTKVTIRR